MGHGPEPCVTGGGFPFSFIELSVAEGPKAYSRSLLMYWTVVDRFPESKQASLSEVKKRTERMLRNIAIETMHGEWEHPTN